MSNKETLIKLAQDKGFKSQIFTDTEWLYSSKEDLRYYLWMCELELWTDIVMNFDRDYIVNELESGLITFLNHD